MFRRSSRLLESAHYGFYPVNTDMNWFRGKRTEILKNLAANTNDKSLAGGVDKGIQSIVSAVNNHTDYVTLSSCSGRINAFHRSVSWGKSSEEFISRLSIQVPSAENGENGAAVAVKAKKKRGDGLGTVFSSHDPVPAADIDVTAENIWKKVIEAHAYTESNAVRGAMLQLKFEPWILHVLCASLKSSQIFIECANKAGMRRCGLEAPPVGHEGRRKFMVNISTPLGFDTPILSFDNKCLIGDITNPQCPQAIENITEMLKLSTIMMERNDQLKERFLNIFEEDAGKLDEKEF